VRDRIVALCMHLASTTKVADLHYFLNQLVTFSTTLMGPTLTGPTFLVIYGNAERFLQRRRPPRNPNLIGGQGSTSLHLVPGDVDDESFGVRCGAVQLHIGQLEGVGGILGLEGHLDSAIESHSQRAAADFD